MLNHGEEKILAILILRIAMAEKTKKAAKSKAPARTPAPKAKSKPLAKAAAKPAAKAARKPLPAKQTAFAKPTAVAKPKVPLSSAAANVLPAALRTLVDKSEIREVLYRFARGIDRIDETLLRSIFHHEASLDLGPGVFQGSANDYIHWVIGVMNGVRSSSHLIGNILPTLEGDVALVETYCQTHYRLDKPTGREDVFIGSRFLDRFERTPPGPAGVWKIMHRKQIIDWVRTQAVSDLFYHQNPDALWSYRTKVDPSYQMAQFPGTQSGSKLPSFLGRRYESKSVKF